LGGQAFHPRHRSALHKVALTAFKPTAVCYPRVMQGVTTAIIVFILMCQIWPQIVKVRSQYYAALGCILLVILLDAGATMFNSQTVKVDTLGVFISSAPLARFVYVVSGLLQVVSILLLVLATGGFTVSDLVDDVKGSYEVQRRGDDEKEIIIPLPPDAPQPVGKSGDPDRVVYKIDDPISPAPEARPAIPLDEK